MFDGVGTITHPSIGDKFHCQSHGSSNDRRLAWGERESARDGDFYTGCSDHKQDEEEGADEQRQRVVDRVLIDRIHLEHALTLCLPLFDHAPTAAGQTGTLSKLAPSDANGYLYRWTGTSRSH